MRFLVLGVSGMAGHIIALYLKEQGHEVIGFARHTVSFVKCIEGDAFDRQLLNNVIQNNAFDVVVNSIGILNNAAEENKEQAVYLNSYLPHFLAHLTKDSSCRVIHLSTDCVFAGNTGPYTENSFPDGTTLYDRSKALGELDDDSNLTLRQSIVGPDINENGIGLLNWFMRQRESVKGYTHAIWTGLTTLELAKAIEQAALSGATGLVNLVPSRSISKFDLLQLFNETLQRGTVEVIPSDEMHLDKTLIRTNYEFNYNAPDYQTMMVEQAEWINDHRSLYPHYELCSDWGTVG